MGLQTLTAAVSPVLQERLHGRVRLQEPRPGNLLPAAGCSAPQLGRSQPSRQRVQLAGQGQAEAAEARSESALSWCPEAACPSPREKTVHLQEAKSQSHVFCRRHGAPCYLWGLQPALP